MKKINLIQMASCTILVLLVSLLSCKKEVDDDGGGGGNTNPGPIVGTPGNPRFNLQFTNGANVDLDLHVITPNGTEVYYANTPANGGTLDVDCICGSCGNSPNENIFWQPGAAPRGTYKVYVDHYSGCSTANSTSTFTLRIMNQNQVIQTYTGTLSEGQRSQMYSFTF